MTRQQFPSNFAIVRVFRSRRTRYDDYSSAACQCSRAVISVSAVEALIYIMTLLTRAIVSLRHNSYATSRCGIAACGEDLMYQEFALI